MDELKNNEIESIKTLIRLLSKKGYVLRSELEHILRGCRSNSFVLSDVENLMRECIEEDVDYVDDRVTDSIVRIALEIQKKIELMGYEDLYEYLEVESDASNEEVLYAIKRKKEQYHNSNLECLIENNGRQTYEAVLRSKEIIKELQLRQSFTILSLKNSEYRRYISDIVVMAYIDEKMAKTLLDGIVINMGFVVEKDIEKTVESEEKVDKYLVGTHLEQDQKRQESINEKNRFGGNNNGRH